MIAEIVAALQACGIEIDGDDEEAITANVRRVEVSADEIRIAFKDAEVAVCLTQSVSEKFTEIFKLSDNPQVAFWAALR